MPSDIRVTHLIGSGGVGGREKQLYLMLRAQAQQPGFDVGVVFQNPEGANYDRIADLKNVRIGSLGNVGEFSLRAMFRCLKEVRRSDVVILHSPRIAFMLPLQLTRVPLIYRLSGIFIAPPGRRVTGSSDAVVVSTEGSGSNPELTMAEHSRSNPGRIVGVIQKFVVRAQRLTRWWLFRRTIAVRSTVVLMMSQYLQHEAKDLYGLDEGKCRLVRIGVDQVFEQQRIDSASPIPRGEEFTIGVVARLDSRKRIDRLMQAIVPLLKSGRQLRVVVAGQGPELDRLLAISRSLEVDPVFEFIGAVENPYDVLRSLDLFVLPSDNEAFSNSVLEAMVAACPVVVFAGRCGAAEVIKSGIDGFVVEDIPRLTSLLDELIDNREHLRNVGLRARAALADKGLTFEQHLASVAAIIHEVARA